MSREKDFDVSAFFADAAKPEKFFDFSSFFSNAGQPSLMQTQQIEKTQESQRKPTYLFTCNVNKDYTRLSFDDVCHENPAEKILGYRFSTLVRAILKKNLIFGKDSRIAMHTTVIYVDKSMDYELRRKTCDKILWLFHEENKYGVQGRYKNRSKLLKNIEDLSYIEKVVEEPKELKKVSFPDLIKSDGFSYTQGMKRQRDKEESITPRKVHVQNILATGKTDFTGMTSSFKLTNSPQGSPFKFINERECNKR